jgi:hypothetical protein
MSYLVQQTATIAAGASLSGVVSLTEHSLHGILLPSVWTTANLTFQASVDGTNFFEMYDDAGNEITVTAAAARYCALDPTRWRAINCLIVRSGTSATPVNQVAAAAIILNTRAIF